MVLDWGVHLLDQMNMMMGKCRFPSTRRSRTSRTRRSTTASTAVFMFDNGVKFTVEVGTSNFINLPRWYILGLNGSAVIEDWDINGKIVVATSDEEHDAVPIVTAAGLTKTMAPRTPETIREYPLERIDSDIHDYYRNIAAVIEGRAKPLIKADEVMRVFKLMEAIRGSAESGRVIDFETA
jgi:scyllo-inositol 2-dehydrogenase (NADP+)